MEERSYSPGPSLFNALKAGVLELVNRLDSLVEKVESHYSEYVRSKVAINDLAIKVELLEDQMREVLDSLEK